MADALAAVEAAISEVTKLRNLVTKRSSKQVDSGEEIDQLKAVTYAWLQNHQLVVNAHHAKPDLDGINTAYKTILDATGRRAARTTYSKALQAAKLGLVKVRGTIASAAPPLAIPATTDAAPNFGPLALDLMMQAILQRRWGEVQLCMSCKANLAATVMMGGLLESLLLARMTGSPNQAAIYTAKAAPRDKQGKTLLFNDWKLINMVEVAHELQWVTKSAKDVGNVLREFRNYIHPHKEFTDKVTLQEEDTQMFWEVTKSITRQVLTSVGKTP